jgi:UDP-N-acetylmuramoylalanine--D-glutamate ligase
VATPAGACRADSWIEDGVVSSRNLCSCRDIPPGLHNLENCLAAATAAAARGVEKDALAEGLRSFPGVTHRLEEAGMVGGVTYVNDSKATNVEATLTALNAYPERTHLILGGRDKASDYRRLPARVRAVQDCLPYQEAAPLIAQASPRPPAEVRKSARGHLMVIWRGPSRLPRAAV